MKKQSIKKLGLVKIKIASLSNAAQKTLKGAGLRHMTDNCQSEMNDCFSIQIRDCTMM